MGVAEREWPSLWPDLLEPWGNHGGTMGEPWGNHGGSSQNLWWVLKKAVAAHKPKNISELKAFAHEEWAKIPQ